MKRLKQRWRGMLRRCHNSKDKNFHSYGGRGITVCAPWRESFEAFQAWALTNGYDATLTLDRKDANGIYEPSNCQWITMEANRIKRRNVLPPELRKARHDKSHAQWQRDHKEKIREYALRSKAKKLATKAAGQ